MNTPRKTGKISSLSASRARRWAVNWRPVHALRFALEYEHANIDGGPAPRHFDALAARAQLQF